VSDNELALHQLQTAFLEYVEQIHEQHGFETDYRILARKLGISVDFGSTNQAVSPLSGRLILIDPSGAPNRERFTGLHEISHLLFEEAEDGYLRARLKDIFYHQKNFAKLYEESLCDAAAALLLMPRHRLKMVLEKHSYSPLAALELVNSCSASLQAAMRRIIWSHDVAAFAFLLSSAGYVIDSFSHGHPKGYTPGIGFNLEHSHPLRVINFASDRIDVFEAAIPFKNGNRNWKMQVQACCDSQKRVVAFFNRTQIPQTNDGLQESLF
jgi:Zn-dependent peptidase ImmA (M78 family)